MSKKYRLDNNEVAFLKVLYSTFAALDLTIVAAQQNEEMSWEEKLKTLREIVIKAQEGLSSEYIRGELIRKEVLPNDPSLICKYDPSIYNENQECEVLDQADQALAKKSAKE